MNKKTSKPKPTSRPSNRTRQTLGKVMYDLGSFVLGASDECLESLHNYADNPFFPDPPSLEEEKQALAKHISAAITGSFAQAGLDSSEIIIVSLLWIRTVRGSEDCSVKDVLKNSYRHPVQAYSAIKIIRRLIALHILATEDGHDNLILRLARAKDDVLYKSPIKLTQPVIDYLTGNTGGFTVNQPRPDCRAEASSEYDLIRPEYSFSDLIVRPELEAALKKVISLKHGRTRNLLAKWGVDGYISNPNRGFSILMHGVSGTGKTLAAEVIATEMERLMLKIDCNCILSKWYGETEKNAKALFEKYYELCQSMPATPIMMFNEADQLFNSRYSQNLNGSDKTWNAVQNLILEAMEEPQGIIIATTNLLENFDEAYKRRFDLILEFRLPELCERMKIWEVRLPKNLPGVQELDIKKLASFALSGGQITKVIRNAALHLAGSAQQRRISTALLVKYCQDELAVSFQRTPVRKPVGFCLNSPLELHNPDGNDPVPQMQGENSNHDE